MSTSDKAPSRKIEPNAPALNPFNHPPALRWMSAVVARFRSITLVGLPDLKDRNDIATEALYVPLKLKIGPEDPVSPEEAIAQLRRLVVLGDPGAGKSTLIAWLSVSIGLRLAEAANSPLARFLPLPVVLRDIRVDPTVNTFDALWARAATQSWWGPAWHGSLEAWIDAGQAVLLVDGLDEVADVNARRAVCAALRDASRTRPGLRVLVTSRRVGYDEAPVEEPEAPHEGESVGTAALVSRRGLLPTLGDAWGARGRGEFPFVTGSVLPFDDGQIGLFARRWYRVRMGATGTADAQAETFLRAVRVAPGLQGMASNPSLLALMALVHRVYATLPSGRAVLFEKMTEAYLESIDRARRLPGLEHPWSTKQRWLARLATRLQARRMAEEHLEKHPLQAGIDPDGLFLTQAEATSVLTEVIGDPAEAERFLDEVLRRSGILVPRTEDTVAFGHLSFQEYLAAVQLVEELRAGGYDPKLRRAALKRAKGWAVSPAGREPMVLAFEILARGSPAEARGLYTELRKGMERRAEGSRDAFAALAAGLSDDTATGLGELPDARGFQRDVVKRSVRSWRVPDWCRSLEILDGDPGVTNVNVHGTREDFSFRGLERLSGLVTLFDFDGRDAEDWLPPDAPLTSVRLGVSKADTIERLTHYPGLTSVSLSGRGAPTLPISPLGALSNLQELSLVGLRIADNTEALRTLRMSSLTLIGVDLLAHPRSVFPWPGVTELWLGGLLVWSPAVLADLAELQSLTFYQVRWTDPEPRLPFLPALRTLFLHESGLSDLSSLRSCPELKEIRMRAVAPERDLVPPKLRRLIKEDEIPF